MSFPHPCFLLILFELKCDSLCWNFVRVHQPRSSSSPNPAPNTSVTIFFFYFKTQYLVLSCLWICLPLSETEFRRVLSCQVLYKHNETFPQELHFIKVYQSFNDNLFLSLFHSTSLAGALMKAVAWLQTYLLLPSQQTGLSYWRQQNYSGFTLWVTDHRTSSPLSLFNN